MITDSPTQRVGEKQSISSVRHKSYTAWRMLSEELQAWQQRWQRLVTSGAQKVEYVCELKIDGSALP